MDEWLNELCSPYTYIIQYRTFANRTKRQAIVLAFLLFCAIMIIMSKELSVSQHNDMVQGYEIAWAANEVFDLRTKKEVESAKAIAELLARNPDPMQEAVIEAIKEATIARDTYTEVFNGLMNSASALIPARHVFEDNDIKFSTERQYSGPPWL